MKEEVHQALIHIEKWRRGEDEKITEILTIFVILECFCDFGVFEKKKKKRKKFIIFNINQLALFLQTEILIKVLPILMFFFT